jgi:hypothetical protein
MTGKHQKTLRAIFADPVRSNINWTEIEALLMALGAERSEGRELRKEADRGAVKAVRRFLEEGGIRP